MWTTPGAPLANSTLDCLQAISRCHKKEDNGKTVRGPTFIHTVEKAIRKNHPKQGWLFCVLLKSMQTTEKQRLFVAGIVHTMRYCGETFRKIMDTTPQNDDKHPDTRADHRILILADRMRGLSAGQANYIIKAYRGTEGFSFAKAETIVKSAL